MARTDHKTNRLIDESSPYLLQHAHNPVDWYPWGSDAFDAARDQDKPIFLSVGYSTCYWCHVMERECFENEQIAAIMNEHFINIKVDREQRPDVDDIYMTAVQLMTHSGGWPMSVFLEPRSLKPFLGGTYFPPEDRYGRAGFPSVLRQIAIAWQQQREAIVQQAEHVAEAVRRALSQDARPVALRPQHAQQAVDALMRMYDEVDAGFGGSGGASGGVSGGGPKFPSPANLDLLLQIAWDKPQVRRAILHTLDRMALGGIYDQIGGGFHRYSVDEKWLVPHFEKMLYDNGQLLSTYARAFELTHDPHYAHVLRQTGNYLLREMTGTAALHSVPRSSESRDTTGGFFSAQDAEVNHREGENYLWTATQVRETLAEVGEGELSEFALEAYGFNRGTNFRDPHHSEDGPKNVVHLIDKPQALAARFGLDLDSFFSQLDHINRVLREARDHRDQPATDDKIIAGWNGLAIAGLADAGRVLEESPFVDAAEAAATFVLSRMRESDGGLVRTYRNGVRGSDAFLDDYAFMIHGLIALHRSGIACGPNAEPEHVNNAVALYDAARDRFWDGAGGGFFDTLADQPDLFVRTKGIFDGAVPSGNSMMMLNALRLQEFTGERRFLQDALVSLRYLSATIAQRPTTTVLSVLALYEMLDAHPQMMKPVADVADRDDVAGIVSISVHPPRIELSQSTEANLIVTLRIAEGYHINAHDPGLDDLMPLAIESENDALELEVQYPPGQPYSGADSNAQTVRVHVDTLEIPVRVRRTSARIHPSLMLRYQACTDTACLEPREVTVPVTFTASR